ncbi:MAG: hypothetical protein EON52_04520 [Actinomycetales bacterium]|nr:MAG: hypothetical protein EON52_04520 [Actinomycetales bacterium]
MGGSSRAGGPTEIVPGGNVAFADSYGAISYYSVGTASAVCDDTVLAYGHPNNFAPATESMHAASAVGIQSAAGVGSFKMANLGAPVGTQIADGLNGVLGRVGGVPEGTVVTTTTNGVRPRTSRSTVPNPDALSSVVASQMATDLVVSADRYAGGEATASWTINYVADGTTGSLSRSNRYSDADYLPDAVGNDVASDAQTLQGQAFADVKITSIAVTTKPTSDYRAYRFGKIKVKSQGTWRTLAYDEDLDEYAVSLPSGRYFKVRVRLEPRSAKAKVERTYTEYTLRAPSGPAEAYLSIRGGVQDYWYDDEDFEDFEEFEDGLSELPGADTFAGVLEALRTQLRNDQVGLSYTTLQGRKRTTKTVTRSVGAVVSGDAFFVAEIG